MRYDEGKRILRTLASAAEAAGRDICGGIFTSLGDAPGRWKTIHAGYIRRSGKRYEELRKQMNTGDTEYPEPSLTLSSGVLVMRSQKSEISLTAGKKYRADRMRPRRRKDGIQHMALDIISADGESYAFREKRFESAKDIEFTATRKSD